ncbi:THAP domain-containing protein 9, partial [Camponotus floridanus]
IYWAQNKMKVKYAANTFSASVANAIDFLKQEGLDDFKDSDETVTFIKAVDQLFDFLNSRNPFGKNFKQPITVQNWSYLQKMIKEKLNYLFSLKLKG